MRDLLEGLEQAGARRWLAHEGWNQLQKIVAAAFLRLRREYDRRLANRRQDSRRLP
jgi:hypothetical protein